MRKCRYGVHDISKMEPDLGSGLSCCNMPLELGLFFAAMKFGDSAQKRKKCIILDRASYRYQQFICDIAGQDIHSHGGQIHKLIAEVSSWLRDEVPDPRVPGGKAIAKEFHLFADDIPRICGSRHIDTDELTFQDYRAMAAQWIVATNSARP